MNKTKQCRKKCLSFLSLKSLGPFSPLRGPWTPYSLWALDSLSTYLRINSFTGEDGGQEEKGKTEDEMFWWHHQLSGHKFEQALIDSEGQGSLAYSMESQMVRSASCISWYTKLFSRKWFCKIKISVSSTIPFTFKVFYPAICICNACEFF